MRRKSKSFEKFRVFKAKMKKCHGKCIKTLRSDRGDEYFLGEFLNYLSEEGIEFQLFTPGVPQQNGVAKKRIKLLWIWLNL